MEFKNLKEKGEWYRSQSDYKLDAGSYVIVMLDGRSFSKKVKNKFEKPFDENFIIVMNETMKYLCEKVPGTVFGYCQSDEISIIIDNTPKDVMVSAPFFDFRLCKLQSIIASMATGIFNKMMMKDFIFKRLPQEANSEDVIDSVFNLIDTAPLYEFDCKAWNVPDLDTAKEWVIWRQRDCVRNSKQQFAQTYASHRELLSLNVDEQIKKVQEKTGLDWYDLDAGKRQGRYCNKYSYMIQTDKGSAERTGWWVKNADKTIVEIGDFSLMITTQSIDTTIS